MGVRHIYFHFVIHWSLLSLYGFSEDVPHNKLFEAELKFGCHHKNSVKFFFFFFLHFLVTTCFGLVFTMMQWRQPWASFWFYQSFHLLDCLTLHHFLLSYLGRNWWGFGLKEYKMLSFLHGWTCQSLVFFAFDTLAMLATVQKKPKLRKVIIFKVWNLNKQNYTNTWMEKKSYLWWYTKRTSRNMTEPCDEENLLLSTTFVNGQMNKIWFWTTLYAQENKDYHTF